MKHILRSMDLIPLDKLGQKICMVGAGAIGSTTATALAKTGIGNIELWDFDDVSIENIGPQNYPYSAIGKKKVHALRDIIKDHSGETITVHDCAYEAQALSGIVIAAVDSMAVRLKIWNKCKNNPMVKYFIDPRMSIEYALMYCINPNDERDIKTYEKTLYTDENSVQEPCTLKSVIYTANLISGLIAKTVKDILCDANYPRLVTWDIANNNLEIYGRNHGRTDRAAQPTA